MTERLALVTRLWNHALMNPKHDAAERRLGMFFVAAAAILFASKGLFSKALYQRGVGFELLVAVRAVLAMPLFAWFAFRANTKPTILTSTLGIPDDA